MTREQNQLMKKIRNLSPEDVARVLQFLQQLKSPELRVVPTELKAVTSVMAQDQASQSQEVVTQMDAVPAPTPAAPQAVGVSPSALAVRQPTAPAVAQMPERPEAPVEPISPEAEVARAACAQWRRRPFQAIDADDLQPIAALFREAVDTRAQSRFRYGGSR
jgi:hypothetical protein